jgi:hypothetical protein
MGTMRRVAWDCMNEAMRTKRTRTMMTKRMKGTSWKIEVGGCLN